MCRVEHVEQTLFFTVIYFYIMFHVRNDQIVNILKFLLTKQKENVINCGTANVCSVSNKIIFFQLVQSFKMRIDRNMNRNLLTQSTFIIAI